MNSQITLAKRKRNTHSEWNGRQNCEAFHWRKRQRKREWMREWSEQERVERSKKGKGEGSIIAMQLMLFLCRSVAVGLCLCLSVCVSVVPLAFSLFSSFCQRLGPFESRALQCSQFCVEQSQSSIRAVEQGRCDGLVVEPHCLGWTSHFWMQARSRPLRHRPIRRTPSGQWPFASTRRSVSQSVAISS